jgi:hypothetical protein
MPLIKKMAQFIPAGGDASLSSEFDCFQADATLDFRQDAGNISYAEGAPTLPFIKAEEGYPFVDLPQMLEHMIKYCWKEASVTPGTARGGVQLGGARQTALNNLTNSNNPVDILQAVRMKAQAAKGPAQRVAAFVMPKTKENPHLKGIAQDWKTMEDLERVNAYTFRGDKRPPGDLKRAGGFHPPNTRTDEAYVNGTIYPHFQSYMSRRYNIQVDLPEFQRAFAGVANNDAQKRLLRHYSTWRIIADNESYHAGRMLALEALKGYTSTSRSLVVAKGFANAGGWVYVTLVRGGFLIPDKGKHEWTKIYGEQEIALPGGLAWGEIFGFRQVGRGQTSGKDAVGNAAVGRILSGPIYLRKAFEWRNATAFKECFELLSGKKQ